MEIPKTLGPVDIKVAEFLRFCLSRTRLVYIATAVGAFPVSLLRIVHGENLSVALIPTGVVWLGLTILYLFNRHRMLKRIRSIKESLRGLTWTLSADHLVIQTIRTRSEFPWNEQKKCKIHGDMISLYNLGGMRYLMPIRALPKKEEAREIVAWIQERIEKSKS